MNITATITLTLCGCAFIITALLSLGTFLSGNRKEKVYLYFLVTLLLCTVGVCFEAAAVVTLLTSAGARNTLLFRVVDFLSYTLGNLSVISFAVYIYEYLSMRKKMRKTPFVIMIVCGALNIVLLAVAHIFMPFFVIDASRGYATNGLATLVQVLPSVIAVMLIVITLQSIRVLKTREWVSLLAYLLIPMICYIIENIFSGFPLWVSYFGTAVSLLLVYINIQVDLGHRLRDKELELQENRVAIMLSQIKPHYLYNSLVSIERLCDENPAEARVAIMDFADYLRGNMNSLTQQKPIRFSTELTHVRNYLALELHRFKDRLRVAYDIQTEDFSLPALTLQPLVENAVRHGAQKRREPTTVTIASREEPDCFVVTVQDDANGFDTDTLPDIKQSHIGIPNVRARLENFGARLELQSTLGEGTLVVITVPKEVRA